MMIGGLQKFSLLDYPDAVSAIVFTQGCNFRCHFCYNPMLVVWDVQADELEDKIPLGKEVRKGHPRISEDDLFDFLHKRVGKLDAIVITGGEPTLHPDLPDFIKKIRDLGFKIKLDTNGTNPDMIQRLLDAELLDYIAMDIKSSPEKYADITGVPCDMEKLKTSIQLIKNSGLGYEFRTTVVPGFVEMEDISKMGEMIRGAEKWYLQQFQPNTDLIDSDLKKTQPHSRQVLNKMKELAEGFVGKCGVR